MKLPELGEGVLEAELVEWLVGPGDEVRIGETIVEVLTDKAAIALPSPFTGRVLVLNAKPGDMISVGAEILSYQNSEAESGKTTSSQSPSSQAPSGQSASNPSQIEQPAANANGKPTAKPAHARMRGHAASGEMRPKAAPSVRRKARALGVDLREIRGSGPGQRVLMDDLSAAVQSAKSTAATHDEWTPGGSIPFRGMRRKIAEHMVRSKTEIPHYSFMDECDVTELVRMREQMKPKLAEKGVRLTYLSFIVKAVAESLREFPLINASLDTEKQQILLHDEYHIGIAVATAQGLVVPVIKNANQLSLGKIAESIQTLSEKARGSAIELDDLRGATFVVTSIGGIGGLISTPIINQPNVGIMGVGRIVRRPMYDQEGQIHPADLLYLSYSFDHRVVDGAIGAEFNNAVMRRLQDPVNWMIPV